MTRKEEKLQLICKDESYVIIGACMALYKDKPAALRILSRQKESSDVCF
jgi:hypothetical protein